MAFCENNQGGSPAVGTAIPAAGTGTQGFSFADVLKNQVPAGMQLLLGSAGVKGFPSLRGNQQTQSAGMATPGMTPPTMTDPAVQKSSRMGNL